MLESRYLNAASLIAATGFFFLLRSLKLSPAAAAFGAISFALGGLMMSLNNLVTVLYAVSWMPWLALFGRRFFRERRLRDFALAALILGLILLIGEQSVILQCGALLAAYGVYRWRSARALIPTAAICAIALLVGLAQILPALDHQRDSSRAHALTYADVTTWSLFPARPLELVNANAFGNFAPDVIYFWASDHPTKLPWLFSIYAGLFAAALIVTGFVLRIRGWAFVAAVSLVSYVVAIGKHGPVIPLLYKLGVEIREPEPAGRLVREESEYAHLPQLRPHVLGPPGSVRPGVARERGRALVREQLAPRHETPVGRR